jgi:hypothetical protein
MSETDERATQAAHTAQAEHSTRNELTAQADHAAQAKPALPRSPLEVVVDGTDGAGKTSFVTHLLEHCRSLGLRAASHAPYREREVYPLWADEPERAAQLITEILDRRRAESAHLDVLIWDRGWPTAYITTDNPRARSSFLPLPPVTILLLGTPEMTLPRRVPLLAAARRVRPPQAPPRLPRRHLPLRLLRPPPRPLPRA